MNYQHSIFAFFVVFVFAAVSCQQNSRLESDCSICDLSKCAPPGICHVGTTRDRCGCCEVCALEEGHLCNESPSNNGTHWHGLCGVNMECKLFNDEKSFKTILSACVCETKGYICGSDGITYSPCQFMAVQSRSQITEVDKQPCRSSPKLISHSESTDVSLGDKHSIFCEFHGSPIPNVFWRYKTPEGNEWLALPGDSDEMSVIVRGGPEMNRVTTYLQISNFQRKHEGYYECVADSFDKPVIQNFELSSKRVSNQDL